MDFQAALQMVHFVIPPATFFLCLRAAPKRHFSPILGLFVALFVVAFGVAVNGIGAQLNLIPHGSVGGVLLMTRESVWHGTTVLAIGYGLALYSVWRLVVPRRSEGSTVDSSSADL
jgi:hypothetical protein